MQVSKNRIAVKLSSANRAATFKSINRKGKNGNGQTGVDDSSGFGPRLHFLESTLRSKSLFELSIRSTSQEPGIGQLLKIVDSEEKQLQAITDLHEIVLAQPKYKNLKEPNWKESNTPIEILLWLLRKLGPLAKGNSWTIDTYRENRKTRYRFIIHKHYNRNHVGDRDEHFPLDFLPGLKNRDLPLHDMIIDLIALVSKANKIPLWDEDGDFSLQLDRLKAESKSDNDVLERQKESYLSGPAFEYLNLIKARRRSVKELDINMKMIAYDAKSQRKRSLLWWVRSGLEVAYTKQCIAKNTLVPNFITGNPVTPFRLYKFIWSSHENDVLKTRAYSQMKKDNTVGCFLPMMFSVTLPGQKVKPLKHDPFPLFLYGFMSLGVKNVLWRFREYFYKKTLSGQQTPSEIMLEKIYESEIRLGI